LPLVNRWQCQASPLPVDVVLAIDTSSSMTGAKLAAAKQAAATFVNLLDLRPGQDRAAVVGFNTTASLAQVLTANRAAVQAGLAGLVTSPGTRIDLGLELATAELTGSRRRGLADRVIVLLSDGLPQAGSENASVTAGAQARAAGIGLWAIGLGSDAAPALLVQITGAVDHLLVAPGPDDLEGVYRRVANGIVCR
jgi:tight adherence protein B